MHGLRAWKLLSTSVWCKMSRGQALADSELGRSRGITDKALGAFAVSVGSSLQNSRSA